MCARSANVLVDAQMQAKLSDFGLTRAANPTETTPAGRAHTPGGTPSYWAPEVFLYSNRPGQHEDGRLSHTAASDVFSYGMVIAELFAQKVGASPSDAWACRLLAA